MSSSSSRMLKTVARELAAIATTPLEDVVVIPNDANLAAVEAWIRGPAGTPYAGGCFRVLLHVPAAYPSEPPKGWFKTKIHHPNVSPKAGEICVSTLKRDWQPVMGLAHVLLTIKCLLIHPNPESALNEDAGRQLLDDYASFASHARMMTRVWAKPPSHVVFLQPDAASHPTTATATVAAAASTSSSLATAPLASTASTKATPKHPSPSGSPIAPAAGTPLPAAAAAAATPAPLAASVKINAPASQSPHPARTATPPPPPPSLASPAGEAAVQDENRSASTLAKPAVGLARPLLGKRPLPGALAGAPPAKDRKRGLKRL